MKLTPFKRFIFSAVPFAVLGAAFKVMTLVEGLTEIRPANAIPMIAGLLCGPAGAFGCAAGNLIADFFGSLSWASILGMAGNFLAAYLPWRLWHLFSREKPNVHTFRNLALYAGLSLVSALTVAWFLSFGLELFFGHWVENIYKYIFNNNFAFSLGLGLPLFIVLTSDSVNVEPCAPPECPKCMQNKFHPKYKPVPKIAVLLYFIIMLGIFAGVFAGFHLKNSVLMNVLSAFALILLIFLCIMPGSAEFAEYADAKSTE